MIEKLKTPITKDEIRELQKGDEILLDGTLYTVRDQAHKRLIESGRIPDFLKGQLIYYCGPTPARPTNVIGSCGPTTSSRMDKFTPPLLKKGIAGTIGKGNRSQEVKDAIKRYRSVYFVTIAGAGAYLKTKVTSMEPVMFKDLGPEAIYKLEVKDFPLYVAVDSRGRSIY